jgi:hypothetical protein
MPTSPRNEKADRELNRSRHYGCVRLKWQLRTRRVADKVAVSAAAVLYGDKNADLQKHCMKVITPNYRTWLARRVAPNRA